MEYLVLAEVSKKQEYIFKSNKLSENVGASLIIKYITEDMPNEILAAYGGIEVFQGGGKSIYRFLTKVGAEGFISKLSKTVITEFPGVELFMVIEEFDIKEDIIKKINDVYDRLEKKKNKRNIMVRQIGFGIEKVCSLTGVPASYNDLAEDDETIRSISKESHVKREFSKNNDKDFNELLPEGYQFTKALDDLISNNSNKSYIAIVHIDGNRMGNKFEQLKEYYKATSLDTTKNNEEYLKALKKLSDDIKKCYTDTFKEMCNVIVSNKDRLKDDTKIEEGIFPLRPLIFAGDDISFVANGKIGIEATKVFIEKLQEKKLRITDSEDIKLNACGGVAIVKAKYPFAKAYILAEELCKNGKSTIIQDNNDEDTSLIDWHIDQGEISGNLGVIRREYYQNNKLTMKPIYINQANKWNRYENFKQSFENITRKDVAKSKVKNLREIFRQGEDVSKVYIKLNKLDEKVIMRLENTEGDFGFNTATGKCMYYDALEAMDLLIELKED